MKKVAQKADVIETVLLSRHSSTCRLPQTYRWPQKGTKNKEPTRRIWRTERTCWAFRDKSKLKIIEKLKLSYKSGSIQMNIVKKTTWTEISPWAACCRSETTRDCFILVAMFQVVVSRSIGDCGALVWVATMFEAVNIFNTEAITEPTPEFSIILGSIK